MVVDKNGTRIDQGDEVQWCDPEEEARDLERIWTVNSINGDIVLISDDYSEAEVLPSELIVCKKQDL